MLIVPNPESALNEDAGRLLLNAYNDFAHRARMMTKIHAVNQNDDENAINPESNNMQENTEPVGSIDSSPCAENCSAVLIKNKSDSKKRSLKRL